MNGRTDLCTQPSCQREVKQDGLKTFKNFHLSVNYIHLHYIFKKILNTLVEKFKYMIYKY